MFNCTTVLLHGIDRTRWRKFLFVNLFLVLFASEMVDDVYCGSLRGNGYEEGMGYEEDSGNDKGGLDDKGLPTIDSVENRVREEGSVGAGRTNAIVHDSALHSANETAGAAAHRPLGAPALLGSYDAGMPAGEFWRVEGPKTSDRPLLEFVMIVKNEAKSIVETIESVKPWVDRWTILDTGSTDNTVELSLIHI